MTSTVEMKFPKRIGKSRLPTIGREVLKQEVQTRTRALQEMELELNLPPRQSLRNLWSPQK